MFPNIRIVLINTSHPGNIGSAARAMKTMGFSSLFLVAPQLFPHAKAQEMASAAGDILEQAVIVNHLDEAIRGCSLIIGTSARWRTVPWPLLSPRKLAEQVAVESKQHQVAILFGREQTGLTNDELHCCHFHVHIPSNPAYSSLNLAAAVQLICYELRVALLQEPDSAAILGPQSNNYWDYRLATHEEMQGFYQHLQKALIEIDFLNPTAPRKLMVRLRRLFNRARPDTMEINILRGLLSAIEKKVAANLCQK